VAALASRQQARTDGHSGPRPTDPVDEAVLHAARQIRIVPAGADGTLAASIPFSSDRKFMAEVHRMDAQLTAFVKGAPHVLLERSARLWRPGGAVPITEAERTRLMDVNTRMAAEGLRVLAVASGPVTGTSDADLRGLTFIGFLGLMDPPAEGVKEAIAALRGAGLRTVMLTGDQKLTAEAVGEQLGLGATATFSRVTPQDKLEIVTSLQRQGEIVAMLGDGVNDAPALRKADVGVAMGGRGTDAAKQAASIVLQDDRFATIVAAVEEGRVIFDNIRKFVFYLFSCNLAEVLVLLVAGVAGLPLPLRPMQILWLNLVTDTFPALALAVEPGDADVMKRPPRDPQAAILSSSFLASVVTYAGLITISTLAAFAWGLAHNRASATTMAFLTLGFAQIFHLGNARSDRPVLHPEAATANWYAIAAVVFAAGLQLVAVYATPVAAVLNVTPLTPGEAYVVVVCSAITPVVGQALRLRRAPGDDPRPQL
jgi:Ca2+-transporting ATPase